MKRKETTFDRLASKAIIEKRGQGQKGIKTPKAKTAEIKKKQPDQSLAMVHVQPKQGLAVVPGYETSSQGGMNPFESPSLPVIFKGGSSELAVRSSGDEEAEISLVRPDAEEGATDLKADQQYYLSVLEDPTGHKDRYGRVIDPIMAHEQAKRALFNCGLSLEIDLLDNDLLR